MSGFRTALTRALDHRKRLIASGQTQALRIFGGASDGFDGIYVDVYGGGAVLIVYEGVAPADLDATAAAGIALDVLKPMGVTAVYVKPFARDRSKMGGELPAEATSPTPSAGKPLPEALVISENGCNLEVRLYDGLSTGLFLDQRENRRFVAEWASGRRTSTRQPLTVLNTFAYTCAFSVAAAKAGAATTSVDVSGRYLDWGKRNFEHNALDVSQHRFARMDTFEFFSYAARKGLKYDLIILDPPSFASGSKKKGIRPWSSVADYARLVASAAALLQPRGTIFASTNTTELCRGNRLEAEIVKGLGRKPRWVELPPIGDDFRNDRDRFAARAFIV